MMSGPELKICDIGFGPHTLRVGTNECLPVAISNVRAVFGAPLILNVVLNGCGYREQMRSGCLTYFRTVDDHHDPVPGVRFSPPLGTDLPDFTDGFGRWQGFELSAQNRRALYIPPGFAHGFLTLTDGAEIFYQMSVAYVPGLSRGVRWNDPAVGIGWPCAPLIISDADRRLPLLEQAECL